MKIFRSTPQYRRIETELDIVGIIDEMAKFKCLSDSIASYEYLYNNIIHEFNIICDDTLMKEMRISELLNLKRIQYFEYNVYVKTNKAISILWSNHKSVDLN